MRAPIKPSTRSLRAASTRRHRRSKAPRLEAKQPRPHARSEPFRPTLGVPQKKQGPQLFVLPLIAVYEFAVPQRVFVSKNVPPPFKRLAFSPGHTQW